MPSAFALQMEIWDVCLRMKAKSYFAYRQTLARDARLCFSLVLAVSLAFGMWYYTRHILIPYEKLDAAARGVPRGNLSDLYPRWLGTRELLLHRRNPYGPDITRDSQIGFYGRPLDSNNPADPKDQEAFAYPVYVVFLLAPTLPLSFESAQLVFRVLLLVLTVASVPLWIDVVGLRWSWLKALIAIALTLASFPTVQAIHLQQLGLLVAFLIVASVAALARGRLILAGVLLAIATIKPQMVILTVIWILLWAIADWKQRRMFVVGFLTTILLLLVASQIILPHWLFYFLNSTRDYIHYTQGKSILMELFTAAGGLLLTIFLLSVLARVCWNSRQEPAGSLTFGFATALTLNLTLVVVPETAPHLQLILLPALLLLWSESDAPGRTVARRSLYRVPFLLLAWSWVAAAALDVFARWLLPPTPSIWAVLPLPDRSVSTAYNPRGDSTSGMGLLTARRDKGLEGKLNSAGESGHV